VFGKEGTEADAITDSMVSLITVDPKSPP